MHLGSFEVCIPEGEETRDGYVNLEHKTQYRIRLKSHLNRNSDASIRIDGKVIGTFRLQPWQEILLERPLDDNGCFTFYRSGSKEFKRAEGHKVGKYDAGLIEVTFKLEVYNPPIKAIKVRETQHPRTPWTPPWKDRPLPPRDITPTFLGTSSCTDNKIQSCNFVDTSSNYINAGITGLSGKSDQYFVDVPNIIYDKDNIVKINLRLVEPVGYSKRSSVRPLKSYLSNNVPKPVN